MKRALILLVFALTACGDAGSGGGDAADTSLGDVVVPTDCDADPGPAGPRFDVPRGRFVLTVYDVVARFSGAIDDGPPFTPHVEAERRGLCRLLTYAPSSCARACEFDEGCIDGVCQKRPGRLDAGALTLTGVSASPVTVPWDGFAGYYWDAEGDFAPARVGLAAAGGDVGPFELETCAPPALVPTGDWSALLEARSAGADVELRWQSPAPGARVYLRMTTGIGTHGGISPVELECEGPDTGALTLPGPYLDALFAEGWSCGECGGNQLERYFADDAEVAGVSVQLRASTAVQFFFHP